MGFETGGRGISGKGAGGVSSRRDGQLADAEFHAHRDGAGESARFEGTGGIEAFVFDRELGRADALTGPPGRLDRRHAFAE